MKRFQNLKFAIFFQIWVLKKTEDNKVEVEGNKAKVGDNKAEVVVSKAEAVVSKAEAVVSKDMEEWDSKAEVAVDSKDMEEWDSKPEAVVSKARDVEVDSKANRHEEGNRLKEVANIKPKEVSKRRYHSGPKHNQSLLRQG